MSEYIKEMQQADASITYTDTILREKNYDHIPATVLEENLQSYTDWYRSYCHISKLSRSCIHLQFLLS